jgi:hypothetical protein
VVAERQCIWPVTEWPAVNRKGSLEVLIMVYFMCIYTTAAKRFANAMFGAEQWVRRYTFHTGFQSLAEVKSVAEKCMAVNWCS